MNCRWFPILTTSLLLAGAVASARASYIIDVTVGGSGGTTTTFPSFPDGTSTTLTFGTGSPINNGFYYSGSITVTVTTGPNSFVQIAFSGSLGVSILPPFTNQVEVTVIWTNDAPVFVGSFTGGTLVTSPSTTPATNASLAGNTSVSLPNFTAGGDTVTATLTLQPAFGSPITLPSDTFVKLSGTPSGGSGGGPTVVPVPSALVLLASALPVGVWQMRRRRKTLAQ